MLMLCSSIHGQYNRQRDDINLKMSVIWDKLFNLIDDADWVRVETMNMEVKDLLTHNCKQQEILFTKYNSNLTIKGKSQSKDALALVIANSITLELQYVIAIKDNAKRKSKLKNLFAELIAIQYPLKSVDFAYYNSLFYMIKTMYGLSSDKEILRKILYSNTYFFSLNNICL